MNLGPDTFESVRPYAKIGSGNEPMNSFNIIAGSGHCGTKWLAAVLDSQPGVTFHHQYLTEMTGAPWELTDIRPPDDPFFQQYWRWIRGELHQGDTGDANSWPPHRIPLVNEVHPIGWVIYLVRNGVQQLNSFLTTSPAFSRIPLPKAASEKFAALAEIGGYGPIDNWSVFKKLCLTIAANDFMPDWLASYGILVDIYSLEELTTDVSVLQELAPMVDVDEYENWQRKDINQKTEGDRDPFVIWESWTDEQRADYIEVVGDPEL